MTRPLNRYGRLATLIFRLAGLALVLFGLAGMIVPRVMGVLPELPGQVGRQVLLVGGLEVLAGLALMGLGKPLAGLLTRDLEP